MNKNIKSVLKKTVKSTFAKAGLEIRRPGGVHLDMPACLSYLKKQGVCPKTVIDVGVADGTYPLYETFPEATHLLVEPLVEFKESIARIQAAYRTVYVPAAAGEKNGTLGIYVKPYMEGSSAYAEKAGGAIHGELRQVELARVDDLVTRHRLRGPYLLKVDVEGAEMQVLAGAPEVLREAEVVILEATFIPKLEGSPAFGDIVRGMEALGYAVYDLFNLSVRPVDGALFQCDAAFVKAGSRLRRNLEWQAPATQL